MKTAAARQGKREPDYGTGITKRVAVEWKIEMNGSAFVLSCEIIPMD